MRAKTWFPPDEATAASTLAVFVEWLRATGRLPDADPDTARQLAQRDHAAVAAFAGLPPPDPADMDTWHDLVSAVAWHLLEANTRPDDRLPWDGDPADPRALGALACGATLIRADGTNLRPPPSGPDAG